MHFQEVAGVYKCKASLIAAHLFLSKERATQFKNHLVKSAREKKCRLNVDYNSFSTEINFKENTKLSTNIKCVR